MSYVLPLLRCASHQLLFLQHQFSGPTPTPAGCQL